MKLPRGDHAEVTPIPPAANQGLRLCSGAFRTSPIKSLQVETGEPSLETRRLKLSLQYYMKMKANPENPAYSCVNPEYKRLFNNKPGTIPTLGIRFQPHLEDMEVELDAISVVRPPECPPWLLQQPNILFKGVVNCQNSRDKGPPEGNSARG